MAYVKSFEFDLFISYAQSDDVDELGTGMGWVTELASYLRRILPHRLGSADNLSIYFDQRNLRPNHELDELLQAVRRSALFLAVTSRVYVEREWTRRELQEFVTTTPDPNRLFALELLPLGAGQAYPPPLDQRKRLRLWRHVEPRTTPLPLTLRDGEPFRQAILDLAEDIARELRALSATAPTRAAIGRVADAMAADATGERERRVLLAQATDDLEDERESVRRYLEQFGYHARPEADFPQSGAGFREAVRDELAQCGLFVQLLGPRAGRRPADLPEGYQRAQLEAARAMGVEILQWRRSDLDPATIADHEHQELLTGETVIAATLESFKNAVKGLLDQRAMTANHRQPAPSFVFINATTDDLGFANLVREEFSRRGLTTAIPFTDATGEVDQKMLTRELIECDVLVMLYGDAPPAWLRSQLRLYSKLSSHRTSKPRLLALYIGPPSEKPDDVGISLPDLRRIDGRDGWSVDHLRQLLTEIGA